MNSNFPRSAATPAALEAVAPSPTGDRGDTLIEILIAIVILSLATVALLVAFATSFTASAEHQALSTTNSALKSITSQVVSQVQSTPTFQSCTTIPSASNLTMNTPTGYQAAVTGVKYWNATTGTWTSTCKADVPQQITVTVTNTSSNQSYSSTFVVTDPAAPPVATAGAAYQLLFTTSPSGANVGSPFSTQPVVEITDANGVVVTSDLSPVVLSITTGSGTLKNCVGQETSGVVVFGGCEIDSIGTYTLTATDGSLKSASASLTVGKGLNAITVTSTAPTGALTGGATYTPTATATSGDTPVVTSGTPSICSVSAGGVVSFINPGLCAVNFNDAGNASFNAAPQVTQGIYVYLPNTITVTSTAPSSAQVNGSTYSPTARATSGDVPVVSSATPATCTVTANVVSFIGAGTCTLNFDDPGSGNYVAAPTVQQSFSVARGVNTISLSTTPPSPATYGGTYTPSATATSGDTVSITSSTTSTCTVSLGVVSFVGAGTCTINFNDAQSTNYLAASQKTQTFAITKAPLTVSVSGTQTYGGTASYSANYAGLANGDTSSAVSGTLSCTSAATTTSDPGTYSISSCTGLSAANYTLSYLYGLVTVVKATPTINWSTPAAISYGTALSSTQLNATSTTPGTFSYSSPSGTVLSAGPQSITATLTPSNTTDYNTATSSISLTVNKAVLTVSANAASSTYGSAIPTLGYTITGLVNGDTSSAYSGTGTVSTTATSSSPAGTYTITAGVGTLTATNYTFSTSNGTLTITKAPLTITASAGSQTYGGSVPTITPTYSGFVLSQSASNLTTQPTCVSGTTTSSPAGTYSSSCSGAVSGNYSFTYQTGTTTVAKAILTVTANAASSNYGSAIPTLGYTITGLVNGDTSSAYSGTGTVSTTATSSSPAGTYTITAGVGTLTATNYTFTTVNGTLTINPANLTITASSPTVNYGTAASITPSYSGFVNGDTSASLTTQPTCTTTQVASSAVGTYPSSCSGAVDANYTISYTAGSVTVTAVVPTAPASLSAVIGAYSSGSSTYTLTWTAPSNTGGATYTYSVSYEKAGATSWTSLTTGLSSSTLTYTTSGLGVGYDYNFEVFAVNSKGSGPAATDHAGYPSEVSGHVYPASSLTAQSQGHGPSTTYTITIPVSTAPTDGNTLILQLAGSANAAATGVTETGAGCSTWVNAANSTGSGAVNGDAEIWYASNETGCATGTVTVTFSAQPTLTFAQIEEWSGLSTSTALDGTSPNNTTGSNTKTESSGYVTGRTQNNDLILGVIQGTVNESSVATATSSGGSVSGETVTSISTTPNKYYIGYYVDDGQTGVGVNATTGSNSNYVGAVASFGTN